MLLAKETFPRVILGIRVVSSSALSCPSGMINRVDTLTGAALG